MLCYLWGPEVRQAFKDLLVRSLDGFSDQLFWMVWTVRKHAANDSFDLFPKEIYLCEGSHSFTSWS